MTFHQFHKLFQASELILKSNVKKMVKKKLLLEKLSKMAKIY
jgi:hypothetical protein